MEGLLVYLSDERDWQGIQEYVHDGLQETLWLFHQRNEESEGDQKDLMKAAEKRLVEVIELIESDNLNSS